MVNLVEHELAGNGSLGTVELVRAALERRHHLLHHLVEEDRGQLRVQQGTELEGNLERERTQWSETSVTHRRDGAAWAMAMAYRTALQGM